MKRKINKKVITIKNINTQNVSDCSEYSALMVFSLNLCKIHLLEQNVVTKGPCPYSDLKTEKNLLSSLVA